MKRKRSKTMMALVAGVAFAAGLPLSAQAQGIADLVKQAETSVKSNNWTEAYSLYKQATELYSEARAKRLFGDRMGSLWYKRGVAAMKMGQLNGRSADEASQTASKTFYTEAISSFAKASKIGANIAANKYKNRAVYETGRAKQRLLDYEGALQAYAQFEANRTPRNRIENINVGQLRLDRAMCYFKKDKPNIKKGGTELEFVMRPEVKTKYKIPDAAVVGGFNAYCQATIKEVKSAEKDNKLKTKLETQLVDFINKNRGTLTLPAYQMYGYSAHFMKLTLDVRELGMHRALFAMMGFLPNSTVAQEDMETKLQQLGGYGGVRDNFDTITRDFVSKDLETVKRKSKSGKPHEMIQNILMASYFETEGNIRAAFAIYEMIELYHDNSPKREEYLYHLVRTSYNIGEIFKTTEYGNEYIKDFPQGEHRAEVEEFMLTSLFQNGRYEECVKIANQIMGSLTKGTKQHDTALYCLGGSLYYLGRCPEAEKPLAEHMKLYGKGSAKESQYAVSIQYFEAANQKYLGRFALAGQKLDALFVNYPTPDVNPFWPLAKYDRADCFNEEGDYEKSITILNELTAKFPDCAVIDQAYVLRGKNHQNIEKLKEAYDDYVKGLGLSQRLGKETVEAEVLNYLVALLGDDTQKPDVKTANFKQAVKYYDIFWKKYSDSDYKAEVAASGLAPLRSVNRGKEGLQNLKQVIMQQAQVAEAPGMDKAINSYTEEYLKQQGNTPTTLKNHYRDDFKLRRDQVRAKSLVKMSLVDVYTKLKEEALKAQPKDQFAADKWAAAITAELQELEKYDLSKLNNYVLTSIGQNVFKTGFDSGSVPQMNGAKRFYKQVLENKDKNIDSSNYNEATFGLARVLAETKDAAEMARAYTALGKIFRNKLAEKPVKEKALLFMLRIAHSKEDYSQAIEDGKLFLKTYKGSRSRIKARFTLADAYSENGNKAEAISNYQSVINAATGSFSYSCPAMLKLMDLTWSGNKYKTWRGGNDFIRLTKKAYEKNRNTKLTSFERKKWEEVSKRVDDMANDSDVIAGIEKAAAIEAARKEIHDR